jgi:hypothetical protein
MREFAIVFICFAGLMAISLWLLAITLAIKSGKGILSLFSRPQKHQWLSITDTIAEYSDDRSFPVD